MSPHSSASHSTEIDTYLTDQTHTYWHHRSLTLHISEHAHTLLNMCFYTGLILTSNLQTHTGPSRFPVVMVKCQGTFSSLSLAVVCVICECATQGGYGGLCCDVVVSPCRAWRGCAVETEMEKIAGSTFTFRDCPRDTHSEYSCSISLFSLSDALWSDISGHQMSIISSIIGCVYRVLSIGHWSFGG